MEKDNKQLEANINLNNEKTEGRLNNLGVRIQEMKVGIMEEVSNKIERKIDSNKS